MQNTLENREPLHVAIIMDGNGRWATRRGMQRAAGHRAGMEAVRRVVDAAPDLGVTTLSLFAFSSDNWRRPQAEVRMLMQLMWHYLRTRTNELIESDVRLTVIGRRDRLPRGLGAEIARAEQISALGRRLHLRIAIDYSARDAIVEAARRWLPEQNATREDFARLIVEDDGRDVDLLIRSGGEKRLSDFLLWESAYAELRFVETMWPDFGADDLAAALTDFRGRERRFGGLATPAALVPLH
ncbi:MAG: di-trans,poly-cis-decaprenylcistransferase [Pseudorhodoplanes sp.]|nr:di-trans,poly-cis-decaprenylcistransferase [Pseudorhodoplanes sp.]